MSIKNTIARSKGFIKQNQKYHKHFYISASLALLMWLVYGAGEIVGASLKANAIVTVGNKTLSDIHALAADGAIKGKIVMDDTDVVFIKEDGHAWVISDFKERINAQEIVYLKERGVTTEAQITVNVPAARPAHRQLAFAALSSTIGQAAFAALNILLLVAIGLYVKMLLGGSTFGQRFNRVKNANNHITFAEVAGHAGPKHEVQEVVEYLRNPDQFRRTGAKPPKGILLYGPPGNGKTLLAKAIATESHAEFIEQNGSNFVKLFAGAGAMAVRSLFSEARKRRPCVIFIDEIDAVGGSRNASMGHDERLQTLNALLAELDGFTDNGGIVVIAATNRLDQLDEALVRPGRFDRKVQITQPGKQDRLDILKIHASKLPKLNADLARWAMQTQGFSGADLANLVNEAAIEAARSNVDEVSDGHFTLARDRILMGTRNYGHNLTEQERKVIAYHESGHAIMRAMTGYGKVEKVSILPRGMSLGVTISGYEEERLLQTKEQIHQELLVLMGGRAAEEVFCAKVSSGAANDMERASKMARHAILTCGFGDMGPYVPEHKDLLAEVERNAASWIQCTYAEATELVKSKSLVMERLVEKLLEEDEIDGDQFAVLYASG